MHSLKQEKKFTKRHESGKAMSKYGNNMAIANFTRF
jgi:hypothetical protein